MTGGRRSSGSVAAGSARLAPANPTAATSIRGRTARARGSSGWNPPGSQRWISSRYPARPSGATRLRSSGSCPHAAAEDEQLPADSPAQLLVAHHVRRLLGPAAASGSARPGRARPASPPRPIPDARAVAAVRQRPSAGPPSAGARCGTPATHRGRRRHGDEHHHASAGSPPPPPSRRQPIPIRRPSRGHAARPRRTPGGPTVPGAGDPVSDEPVVADQHPPDGRAEQRP